MRLADFILANTELILREWDTFASSIWPDAKASPITLRDHGEAILRATVLDMKSIQTAAEQAGKSRGQDVAGPESASLASASREHAFGRANSGFDLMALIAEYRALRASVVRLWGQRSVPLDPRDLDDLTRFNESIDQSLMEAVRRYTEQIDQSREMFLGILGHDLRNPLNAMIVSAEALREMQESDQEAGKLASQITASGEAMARMLSDFLDFAASRLGRGMPVAPAPMNLGVLSHEVVEEMRAAYPELDLTLEASGNLSGEWDPARLRQVLSNLIGNAVQHGFKTAPIRVHVSEAGSKVRLAVHNEGEPIPENALSRIFDPLFRGQPRESKAGHPGGSMGLGLYIAREVVSTHGGTIDVESSKDGGTVFTVFLPRQNSVSSNRVDPGLFPSGPHRVH